MKKILFCLGLFVLCLCGCKKDIDWATNCYYVYANRSSSEIVIHYFVTNGNGYEESKFTIPVNGTYTLTFSRWGRAKPLGAHGKYGNLYAYASVSNGEKIVTQKEEDNDELFRVGSYVESSYEEYHRTFVYIFTDDFFADGVPIEPAGR
jgi:hypothetical protein